MTTERGKTATEGQMTEIERALVAKHDRALAESLHHRAQAELERAWVEYERDRTWSEYGRAQEATRAELERAQAERYRTWAEYERARDAYERARQSSSRATEVCPAHVPPNDLGGEPVVRPSAENTATGKHECEACVDLEMVGTDGAEYVHYSSNPSGHDRLAHEHLRQRIRTLVAVQSERDAADAEIARLRAELDVEGGLAVLAEEREANLRAELARRALDGGSP